MSHADWMKSTRRACSQWAETFSVLAGEPRPAEAMSVSRAAEWATFVTLDLGFQGQRRLFALRDEALRNQVGRGMQGLRELHRRLVAAAEAMDGSETSQVMLAIDAALQRIAVTMEHIQDGDVDENALLPDEEEPPTSRTLGEDEVTPPDRPSPHLREGSGGRARRQEHPEGTPRPANHQREGSGSGARRQERPEGSPRPANHQREGSGSGARRQERPEGSPRPGLRPEAGEPPRPEGGGKPRFKSVNTAEDAVIPLTHKKGDSTLAPLPAELGGARRGGADPQGRQGSPVAPADAPPGSGPSPGETPSRAASARNARASSSTTPRPTKGPLRPAALDARVALLRTYVKRLDREVLGAEEDSALEQVVAILSGALSADEDTLARRFRYLDQQYAADDDALFSEPLMRDLTSLLTGLTDRAVRKLRAACELAHGDRLLFVVGDVTTARSPEWLPVVALATAPHGLREGLLPSYLPRLRGPSSGFTFNVGTREGAALVRRLPENRLEFGFIAGPTRLWLTALHVQRNGLSGALNIEPGGDDQPAYFEARLTLPATDETYKVAARFVLAETARFVDRVATA